MRGKEKCRILREIRSKIAEENDIEYITKECTHQGECKGTCPKCESEVRYLEAMLEKKKHLGQRIAVAAVAVGMVTGAAGCGPMDLFKEKPEPEIEELAGEVEMLPEESDIVGGPETEEVSVIELDGDVAMPVPESYVPDTEELSSITQ